MKCPNCGYVFSEEFTECLRCRTSMRLILEVLGYFPRSTDQPFLTIEDIKEEQITPKKELEEERRGVPKEIELNIFEE